MLPRPGVPFLTSVSSVPNAEPETAAAEAETRLTLQSILIKGFLIDAFQLQDAGALSLYCYVFALPPCVRIG